MNKHDLMGMDNLDIFWDYKNDIFELIKAEENKWPLNRNNAIDAVAIGCFNYGVIIGKRLERARHKK